MLFDTVFEVFENGSYHIYNIGCISMIYRFKYAKSESNFDADFEHPTIRGGILWLCNGSVDENAFRTKIAILPTMRYKAYISLYNFNLSIKVLFNFFKSRPVLLISVSGIRFHSLKKLGTNCMRF